MNTNETLAALLIQLSTIIGVQAAIWWPRQIKPGTATARAYRALRIAAVCLSASFLLIIATTGLPFEGSLPQRLILAASLGTLPLTPLSSIALSLEHGRRVRALYAAYAALLLAAALTWFCILRALYFLVVPIAAPWQAGCILGALLLCAIAVVCILEVYTSIRRPKSA